MSMWSVGFDARSLAIIAALDHFGILLAPSVQAGLTYVGDMLAQAAQIDTWQKFMNPTGALAASITPTRPTVYTVEVSSDVPYAHRREFSFKGPDALGRMFPNDPAAYYFTDTLTSHEQSIVQIMVPAIEGALMRLGGYSNALP